MRMHATMSPTMPKKPQEKNATLRVKARAVSTSSATTKMRKIRRSPAADAETVKETIALLRRIGATSALKPVKNVKRYKKVDLGAIKLKLPKAKVRTFNIGGTARAPLIVGAKK
jgi:hypothetical protein